MEGQTIQDAFDLTKPIPDPVNLPVVATSIPVMLCASDANNSVPFDAAANGRTRYLGDVQWARGNYGANAGLGFLSRTAHCGNLEGHGCSAKPENWTYYRTRGVMGGNLSSSMKQITDGTSNTILVAEIRAGVNESDVRGTWAMEGAGPSAIAAHGFVGDARGPNCSFINSDDIAACKVARSIAGGAEAMAQLGMGCFPTSGADNRQACPRSLHAGGINVVMCDGSVQWIGDFIEVSSAAGQISVWDRLNLASDTDANVNVQDGTFTAATSHKFGDGIVPGQHKVTVRAFDAGMNDLPVIPKPYTLVAETPLEVNAKDSPFDIRVPKK